NDFLGISINNRGTHRYFQDQIFTASASTVSTATIFTTLRIKATGVTIVDQGIEVDVSFHIYGAAITTITTVWTTKLNKLFTAKAHATITAITGFYNNRYFINKLHLRASCEPAGYGISEKIAERDEMQGAR